MPASRLMIEMTQPEVAKRLKANPLVLFPAGSVEQHGAHLPAGTDTIAAVRIAELVAETMDGIVLPAPPVGVTRMHMPFEATVTFSPDTYIKVVTEICDSVARHGARDLLIINWHEGNIPSLAIAAEQLYSESGLRVATVQACYIADELYGEECNGLTHAGEIEALAVLASRPDLVRLDRIVSGSDAEQGLQMDRLRRTRTFQPVLSDIRAIAPSGWYGDPTPATEERGRAMMASVAKRIADQAGEFFANWAGTAS